MRFFIELSYNGSAYHGWQRQPNAISVQQVLEESLSTILQETIVVFGAGRTDAGVHASQMFAHFDVDRQLPEALVFKLNSLLPVDIAVHDLFEVKEDAHARFNAQSRSYIYKISVRKNVFNTHFAFSFHKDLNIGRMNEACKILFQYKDFQCFSKSNTDVKTYHCKIMEAQWYVKDDELHFQITADRFLRNMVRAIVGTLIEIGVGKLDVEDLHKIITSKDRSEAGFSVPAHGLYLTDISYPDSIKRD